MKKLKSLIWSNICDKVNTTSIASQNIDSQIWWILQIEINNQVKLRTMVQTRVRVSNAIYHQLRDQLGHSKDVLD